MRHRFTAGIVVGLTTIVLAVAGWLVLTHLIAPERRASPRQWPFDRGELRALMDTVVDQQRERISRLDSQPARDRASSFLEYYQRRRVAAS